LFGGVFSSFSEQWDRWRRKFWGETQKNYLFFWKKDFSALTLLSSNPRLCFVFFCDLNFELFGMMFLVFFQMLPFILWMQKIKSHSLYTWKIIWNEILFFLWAHFWLWNNFFYNHFFFLTFTLVYKKLFCHKYIHTAYYITSEHLSEYIKNTHGYRYHAKVQQNTCFSQLENIFKILCPRNTIV